MGRLVKDVADRAQQHTQRSWKRPYGAGLLIAGFDKTGAHLFYNCPSGAYYDYKAMAIGARSQVRAISVPAIADCFVAAVVSCFAVAVWR